MAQFGVSMPGILYYPTFTPSKAAIYHAVLYQDFISTIAPEDYSMHLDEMMRPIVDADLYRPISVRGVLDDRDLRRIGFQAVRWASSLARKDRLPDVPLTPFERAQIPRSDWEVRVGGPKISTSLRVALLSMGWAYVDPNDPDFLWMAPAVQLGLTTGVVRELAYKVSSAAGCTASDALIPYTDRQDAHVLAHKWLSGRKLGRKHEATSCWSLDLGGIYPLPQGELLISDLVAFRLRYDDERRRLALAVDRLMHEMRENYEHPADVIRQLSAEIAAAHADLESAARARKLDFAVRALSLFVAVTASWGLARYMPAAWPLGVASGIAINVSTTSIRRNVTPGATDFSYLHRVSSAISET